MVHNNTKYEIEAFVSALEKALPPIFARHRLTELSGGLIHSRTIANRMSLGDGPPSIKIGKKVGFSRDSFIEWMTERYLNENS